MKKALTIVAAVLMFAAVSTAPSTALAGPSCGKNADIEAKLIGDKTHCSKTEGAICAAKLGMSAEECKALYASGEYTLVSMSIKGMTCGGCEGKVTASLEKIPGVIKVGTVSFKDETAFVLVDTKKVPNDLLVSTVTDHGYKVEVIPAVARTTTATATTKAISADGKKAGCTAGKTAGSKTCAKVCDSKKAASKDATEGTN